jgi:hypothetical protein
MVFVKVGYDECLKVSQTLIAQHADERLTSTGMASSVPTAVNNGEAARAAVAPTAARKHAASTIANVNHCDLRHSRRGYSDVMPDANRQQNAPDQSPTGRQVFLGVAVASTLSKLLAPSAIEPVFGKAARLDADGYR